MKGTNIDMANKNLTQVEEIETLEGNEKIFVNKEGSLKQIKTKNANFGSASITIFYASTTSTSTYIGAKETYYLYKDSSYTQPATAQEVYDAFMSGLVLRCINNEFYLVYSLRWVDSEATTTNPTNVVFCSLGDSKGTQEVGTYPSST